MFPPETMQGVQVHSLHHVSDKVVLRFPLDEPLAFKPRIEWGFDCISSAGSSIGEFDQGIRALMETGEDWFGVSICILMARMCFDV
jgi:predicted dithiol-disulfide oxidoreductase (DUF899 family)